MTNLQSRHHKGTPDGGRWAQDARGEASLRLDPLAEEDDLPWSLGFEDIEWAVAADPDAPRRERRDTQGPYRGSVPPLITDLTVHLDPEVEAEAAEATIAIARFDAELSERLTSIGDGELSPLSSVLLRTESASSSQIEQITAGARALALASLGEKTGPNASLVATNAAAMQTAMALSEDMSVDSIIDVHQALLGKSAPQYTGKFRSQPVWIGGRGSTPHSASFVAPKHERVPELMEDLVTFSARTDISPFTQAAIAHAQFETIHPFPDGNGRTGRALVHTMLRNSGMTRRLTVPVSSGLLSNVDEYYEALGAYRRGDLNPIVREFSAAAFRSVKNGRALVDDLSRIESSWQERVKARRDAVVWKALPVVIAQPAVTVAYIAEKTGVSHVAAKRAIDQMVEAGVLTAVGDKQRSRVWVSEEIVGALDDFAARAGRRNYGMG